MKPITVTVDYMRGGTGRGHVRRRRPIERLGTRIANVEAYRLAEGPRQADRRGADQLPARTRPDQ